MSTRIRYRPSDPEPPRRPLAYRQAAAAPAPPPARLLRLRVLAPAEALDPAVAVEALRALYATGATVGLEIAASATCAEAALICQSEQAPEVERALRGAAATWAFEPGALPESPDGALRLVGQMERPGQLDWAHLRDAASFGNADPLAAVLEAAQPLWQDERLAIEYRVRPASPAWCARLQEQLREPSPSAGLDGVLQILFQSIPQQARFEPRLQRQLEERLRGAAFAVVGAVVLTGSERARLTSFARSLEAVYKSRPDCGFGGIALRSWRFQGGAERSSLFAGRQPSLLLTPEELAALWHPPSNRVLVPGVAYLRRPTTPLPIQVARAGGLLLGRHAERGRDLPVYLPRADLDAGHLQTIGRTGVGKSTFVHQIVRQLAAAADLPGVGLIDPHGDLVRDYALRSILPGRKDDVLLLDLGDAEYPVGLPLFTAPPGVSREALVQTIFGAIRSIFRDHWSPTRMEDAVFALVSTLCALPDATLLDAPRLFAEAIFRRQAVARLDDPVARQFWADYELLSEAGQRELVRPILYRLRAFYRPPAVRNIVCQTRGVDFGDLMERGGIVLVSLAGSSIQAEADLLGELVIALLHLAALARLDQPPEQRKRFYLAVDESQRFQGASLPVILSEGRKLGLTLILSTQYLDAWGEALAQSVLGNVGTLICFRCGPNDSRALAASLRPFTPEQLENLDRHEAIAKLQIEGTTQPAFDFRTMPISAPADEQTLAYIRAHTRQLYARPRREVEAEIGARDSKQPGSRRAQDVDEE